MAKIEVRHMHMSTRSFRRLSVNVADDVAKAIEVLAERHAITITDVIRRAVSIYKFVDDEMSRGGQIMVQRDGIIKEVRFP